MYKNRINENARFKTPAIPTKSLGFLISFSNGMIMPIASSEKRTVPKKNGNSLIGPLVRRLSRTIGSRNKK